MDFHSNLCNLLQGVSVSTLDIGKPLPLTLWTVRPPKFKPTLCFVGLGRASLEMYVAGSSEHSGESPYPGCCVVGCHRYGRLMDTMLWDLRKRLKHGLKPGTWVTRDVAKALHQLFPDLRIVLLDVQDSPGS